ncbi:MAG: right-handed parallel beta-helix repeat-containing protein [Myxococcota bacterium]
MRSPRPTFVLLPAALAAAAIARPVPARASDGQIEINQTCATLTGCVPGDTPGFPILVTQPGSLRLTSDLVVPDENTAAFRVGADDVRIDLAGFTVSGPTVCSGLPLGCAPTGSGVGVDVDLGDPPERLVVRGGSVRGFGNRGIRTGASATLEDLRVMHNGVTGIDAGARSVVRHCEASLNGFMGIAGPSGAVIEESIVSNNGNVGITVSNSIVERSVISSNGSAGLVLVSGGSAIGNLVSGNRGDGIVTTVGTANLDGNTTIDNRVFGAPSDEDGVHCNSPCNVRNHVSSGNDGYGLNLFSGSAYGQSLMSGNALGGVAGGTNAGGNACSGPGVGSASCP